jgi:hypothetical protein
METRTVYGSPSVIRAYAMLRVLERESGLQNPNTWRRTLGAESDGAGSDHQEKVSQSLTEIWPARASSQST